MADRITETFEFKTQIHTAWDGTEQRLALREEPRRCVSYDFIGVQSWQSQYLRLLTMGEQTKQLQLPLWHAASPLQKKLYERQSQARIRPEYLWSYRNIGAVELWTGDEAGGRRYALNYILANGVLGLGKVMDRDWEAVRTLVLPVATGVLRQEDNYENLHAAVTGLTIKLELVENQKAPEFPAAYDPWHDEALPQGTAVETGLPEVYQGAEIFRHVPPWSADMTASIERNANRLDNRTGVFRYDLKSLSAAETRKIEYVGLSAAEIHNLQRFFYRKKGAWKSFWLPTWLEDLELAEDAAAGNIFFFVKFNLYFRYLAQNRRRQTIAVFFTDHSCEILRLAGYSTDETGERGKVYLNQVLKRPLLKSRVRCISYLCRVRFAEDTLFTDYETTGAAKLALSFREVDE